MTLHEELLTALQRVTTVRVVAALRDPRLGFDGDNDLHLFLPDLHLLSNRMRERYPYGTNDTGVLTEVLASILALKLAEAGRRKVALFQMGDFLDLWREAATADDRVDSAGHITEDHAHLMSAFSAPGLKPRFLLGNHDFDLFRSPNFLAWDRRYFLGPRGTPRPSGIALHGDYFDLMEQLTPDAVQQLAVFLFAPYQTANDYDLKAVLPLIAEQNGRRDFTARVVGDGALGGLLQPRQHSIPVRYNLSGHDHLEKARNLCVRSNQRNGMSLRFAVIGHTHQARIAVHERDGEDFFALIDTGAWVENSKLPDGSVVPNMQLTALADNEVRIYQLDRIAPV
jgi:UDP-2,3-diacylglucosamine pyrophosphatase LpxH